MMGEGLRLAAPLRNALRGERVPEVHKSHRAHFAARDQTTGEAAKDLLRSTSAQWLTGRAHKQDLAPREKGLALLAIILKCPDCRGMESKHALGAELAPANA